MIKLFIAGDYWSGTGPANVTKSLIQGNNPCILYQKTKNKLLRIIEIIMKTLRSDAVVYSAFSVQNLWGFAIAKSFHRPSFYLMHGSIDYESFLNGEPQPDMVKQEASMLNAADFILAVSTPFEQWLKQRYPQYCHKIYTLTNGIDWNQLNHERQSNTDKSLIAPKKLPAKVPEQILSIGGGMPRKNILSICKAIAYIYQNNPDCAIKLIVLGSDGNDSAAIRSYPFVEYRGLVSHEEALSCMASSSLFIQNSSFETFGLAPVEALLQGCSLLLSSSVGASSIMANLQEHDIINYPENSQELQEKILFVLQHPNDKRLLKGIDRDSTSIEYRQQELLTLVEALSASD